MDIKIPFSTVFILILCITLLSTIIIFYHLHSNEIIDALLGSYEDEPDDSIPVIYYKKRDYSDLVEYNKTQRKSIDEKDINKKNITSNIQIQIQNVNNNSSLIFDDTNIFGFEKDILYGDNYFYLKNNDYYISHYKDKDKNNTITTTSIPTKTNATLFYIISNDNKFDSRENTSYSVNSVLNINTSLYLYALNKSIDLEGIVDVNGDIKDNKDNKNENNLWKINSISMTQPTIKKIVVKVTQPQLKKTTKPQSTKPQSTKPQLLQSIKPIQSLYQFKNNNNLLIFDKIQNFTFEDTQINGQNYFYLKKDNNYLKHNDYKTILFIDKKEEATLFYIISNNNRLDSRINKDYNLNNTANTNNLVYLYMFNNNISGVIDKFGNVVNSLNNPNNLWQVVKT